MTVYLTYGTKLPEPSRGVNRQVRAVSLPLRVAVAQDDSLRDLVVPHGQKVAERDVPLVRLARLHLHERHETGRLVLNHEVDLAALGVRVVEQLVSAREQLLGDVVLVRAPVVDVAPAREHLQGRLPRKARHEQSDALR